MKNNSNYILNDTLREQDWAIFYRDRFIMDAYIGVPLTVGGIVSNIIAFWTLGKLARQNATTFLLRGLSVADICVLLNFVALFCFRYADHLSPAIVNHRQLSYFMIYLRPTRAIFIMVNVWTTVLVGINRYIALCRPLQAASLCTIGRVRKHMIYIVLVSIVSGIPPFLVFKFPGAWTPWYYYIYENGFIVIFRFLVPFPMLLFFFVRIIATLHVARRQQLGRHGGQQMTRKFTSMLLILLGVFFVCHVYIWIAHIIILLRPSSLHTDQRHVYGEFVYVFYVGVISDVIYMLNSSVNCIIYLVYIREFRSLLCGRCTYCLPLSQDYDLTKSVQNASTKTTLSGDTMWYHRNNQQELNKQCHAVQLSNVLPTESSDGFNNATQHP